ncbi:tetraacyldisaccharide 4'-kinase [Oecophyllibacter saccharovorans]|uniref:tetraacyldisaccharide 4'-kinase n=1 Tax=Oecophyllibacter saccharovorans TaxID=2558360 RepID=UPI0011414514|nr:tetraacyldisaccharide 4'-kinase [Oecophyllibacter saccharovorans]QDH14565.1 tetraacyldisaccharide 4'-kinase [Oecophyllibacter saccharovorans]
MRLKAPAFWNSPRASIGALLLSPFALLTRIAGWKRQRHWPVHLPVPVICCGGITVGGTGKTPLTLDLLQRLQKRGYTPHVLTRGYGGKRRRGRVSFRDTARSAGDEALILAQHAPTWCGKDRVSNARQAIAAGADCLVMDDGLQDPSLYKDLSILTLDGQVGLGNGQLLPAGPLREPLKRLLKRVHHIAILGPDAHNLHHCPEFAGLPVDQAYFAASPENLRELSDRRVIAFAGIGRPGKFFDMLKASGIQLLRGLAFPDHHVYSRKDLRRLRQLTHRTGTVLATTQKDAVKLPADFRHNLCIVETELTWSDPRAPEDFIDRLLASWPRLQAQAQKKLAQKKIDAHPVSAQTCQNERS